MHVFGERHTTRCSPAWCWHARRAEGSWVCSLLQEANPALSGFAALARLILLLGWSVLFRYHKEGLIPSEQLRQAQPVAQTQPQSNHFLGVPSSSSQEGQREPSSPPMMPRGWRSGSVYGPGSQPFSWHAGGNGRAVSGEHYLG